MVTAVVFDIGGVLLDWNPRYLYRRLFRGDEVAMERFLTYVCSGTWIAMRDAGRPFAEGVRELSARFPEYAEHIAAFDRRWEEMVGGVFEETVAILAALRARGVPTYALTNFSMEKYPLVRDRFDLSALFDDEVVSGAVHLIKPDPAIYRWLLEKHGLSGEDCLFIDDSPVNVVGAELVGLKAHHYRSPGGLRRCLGALGLI